MEVGLGLLSEQPKTDTASKSVSQPLLSPFLLVYSH